MSVLIAIGYPDQATAARSAEAAQRLACSLVLETDAIAVVRRDREGKFHVTTNYHEVDDTTSWGMFWGLLFGILFFVPILGMPVGTGLAAVLGKFEKAGIDGEFQDSVRDMLQPGTSALFLVADGLAPDDVVAALGDFRGTVVTSVLSEKAEAELRQTLHGHPAGQGIVQPR